MHRTHRARDCPHPARDGKRRRSLPVPAPGAWARDASLFRALQFVHLLYRFGCRSSSPCHFSSLPLIVTAHPEGSVCPRSYAAAAGISAGAAPYCSGYRYTRHISTILSPLPLARQGSSGAYDDRSAQTFRPYPGTQAYRYAVLSWPVIARRAALPSAFGLSGEATRPKAQHGLSQPSAFRMRPVSRGSLRRQTSEGKIAWPRGRLPEVSTLKAR